MLRVLGVVVADVADEREVLTDPLKQLIIMLILVHDGNDGMLQRLLIIAVFQQELYEIPEVKIYKFKGFGPQLILMYFLVIGEVYKFVFVEAAEVSKHALFVYEFKFLPVQLVRYFRQARF